MRAVKFLPLVALLFLADILLCEVSPPVAHAQQYILQTTPFTRNLLTAPDANTFNSLLGGGGGQLPTDPTFDSVTVETIYGNGDGVTVQACNSPDGNTQGGKVVLKGGYSDFDWGGDICLMPGNGGGGAGNVITYGNLIAQGGVATTCIMTVDLNPQIDLTSPALCGSWQVDALHVLGVVSCGEVQVHAAEEAPSIQTWYDVNSTPVASMDPYGSFSCAGISTTMGANLGGDVNCSGSLYLGSYAVLNTVSGVAYGAKNQTATGNYTLGFSDESFCRVNSSGGAVTVNLPPVHTTMGGKQFIFKRINTAGNSITIKADGTELIDNANTYTGLSAQYSTVTIVSDNTQWWIISKF